MCLRLRRAQSKASTARRDIVVFKVLRVVNHPGGIFLRSPNQRAPYLIGELKGVPPGYWRETEADAQRGAWLSHGLHAYTNKERARLRVFFSRWVFMSIVPKGAQYYLGKYDQIVSNQLKVLRPMTREEIYGREIL